MYTLIGITIGILGIFGIYKIATHEVWTGIFSLIFAYSFISVYEDLEIDYYGDAVKSFFETLAYTAGIAKGIQLIIEKNTIGGILWILGGITVGVLINDGIVTFIKSFLRFLLALGGIGAGIYLIINNHFIWATLCFSIGLAVEESSHKLFDILEKFFGFLITSGIIIAGIYLIKEQHHIIWGIVCIVIGLIVGYNILDKNENDNKIDFKSDSGDFISKLLYEAKKKEKEKKIQQKEEKKNTRKNK